MVRLLFHPLLYRNGTQRDAAKPLQAVADPVEAELENALALRRAGADPKAGSRSYWTSSRPVVAGSRLELAAELPIAAGSRWRRWSPIAVGDVGRHRAGGGGGRADLVVAEHAPLDRDVLATLVAIVLVAAVVAELAELAELVAIALVAVVVAELEPLESNSRCELEAAIACRSPEMRSPAIRIAKLAVQSVPGTSAMRDSPPRRGACRARR